MNRSIRLTSVSICCLLSLSAPGCTSQAPPPATAPDAAVAEATASREPAAPASAREASVKPGINDAWKGDDVAPLIERLESETREVFTHRVAIADVVSPKPGSTVADIGSGSGFLTEELASRVGAEGKVFAVDINQKLLDQVEARKIPNVETVLTPDDGLALAAESIDLMFICDTYHHFEFPKTILATAHAALKPGAEVVVIEFEKIEGVTEKWIMEHVRADKAQTIAEFTEAGFELVVEHELVQLEQNYVVRFRKPAA